MDKENIKRKFLNARKAKGLTQTELSEMSSISIRTIQRIESGLVVPRAYTLKTISKILDIDLIAENAKEIDSRNFVHDLLIKWSNEVKKLFNFKTYTMKKIIILSAIFCTIVFGVYATSDKQNKIIQETNLKQGKLTSTDKMLPCGFYAQVVDGDTTYYGLITETYTDMKEIAPTVNYTSEFGYEFSLTKIGVIKKQLKGLKPKEYPKNFKPSLNDTTLLYEIGFKLTVPNYNFKDSCVMPVGPRSNALVGFFFNKSYLYPIGIGTLDESYFRDHYDLKEVLNKFKDIRNLKVTLNNKKVNKKDHKRLANYDMVNFSDIRSVIVYKEGDDCEIIIKAI